MTACMYCDMGLEPIESSVSAAFIHPDAPEGRSLCYNKNPRWLLDQLFEQKRESWKSNSAGDKSRQPMTAAIHTHTCSGCGAGLTCACEDRRDVDRITGRHRNLRCLKCCDAIVMALDLGIELTESMLAHVSHGGPSRADGKRWVDQAKVALNPAPIRCDNPTCDWSGTIPQNGRCPKCNGQGFLLPAVRE